MATTSTSALSASEQADLVESSKRAAAYEAVKEHMDLTYTHVGIGSGSTVVYVVEAIAALGRDATSRMAFFPTGEQSRELIRGAGLNLQYVQDLPEGKQLDVCFDGADEVDEELNLIKGGGACLFQEKLIVTKAKKFVCVAGEWTSQPYSPSFQSETKLIHLTMYPDFRKMSARLGTSWKKGIPIEVVYQATGHVLSELKKLGAVNPVLRSGLPGKAGSIVTDNGNSLIDAPFPPLALAKDLKGQDGENGVWTVDGLADRLIKIVGVVEVGLFAGANGFQVETSAQKPVAAYFGMADGTVQSRK
ncbi:pentose phosphate metabolism-3 [Diaporthe helianthi]|uniref:Ribose-5-phosphate isomerase n=1 Tax=Diaporthe helianthi TaxID=158607 RepID=A0A2P5I4N7_DIAHE|nr:pentose phosphate metabolism-3 [Diaporthe helianthi]